MGGLWRKVKYIIDFLSLSCYSLHLSTSLHLSSSTSSFCLWWEQLSARLPSSSYVKSNFNRHNWIHLGGFPSPIKLSDDPLKPCSGYLCFCLLLLQSGYVISFLPDQRNAERCYMMLWGPFCRLKTVWHHTLLTVQYCSGGPQKLSNSNAKYLCCTLNLDHSVSSTCGSD